MGEHRVPLLSGALRRFEDPETSSDPRLRAVVAELRTLQVAPEPRAHFRAELRAQLVAVAPRIVAEGRAEDLAAGTAPDTARRTATATASPTPARRPSPHPRVEERAAVREPAPSFLERVRGLNIGRPLGVVTAVVAAFALLLGGAVWMSKKSLPGDSLYGLKRASENVQIALDSDPVAKAKDYLSFANTRVDEARDLLGQSGATASGRGPLAGGVSAHTASLVAGALGNADSDVQQASRLLAGKAVASRSKAPLTVLTSWAPGQLAKLRSLAAAAPAGSLKDRVASSASLVSEATARAHALSAEAGCGCLRSTGTDSLGPRPCSPCTAPVTTTPGGHGSGTPTQGRSTPHRGGTTAPGSSTSTGSTGGAAPTTGAAPSTAPASSGLPTSGLPHLPLPTSLLPHLPLPTSSLKLPVTLGSCGVGVSLGPIGLNLGGCTTPAR